MIQVCQSAACLAVAIAGVLNQLQPPPIESMPLSVTSYYIFDDEGHVVAWEGQADSDPSVYANMQPTSPADAGKVAACIGDWVTLPWTTAVSFTWKGEPMTVACYDAFGLESYRRPFYHDGYGAWCIPIDILSPTPYQGLVWDWSTEMVEVGN